MQAGLFDDTELPPTASQSSCVRGSDERNLADDDDPEPCIPCEACNRRPYLAVFSLEPSSRRLSALLIRERQRCRLTRCKPRGHPLTPILAALGSALGMTVTVPKFITDIFGGAPILELEMTLSPRNRCPRVLRREGTRACRFIQVGSLGASGSLRCGCWRAALPVPRPGRTRRYAPGCPRTPGQTRRDLAISAASPRQVRPICILCTRH